MPKDIETLKIEIEELASSSEEDFKTKFWNNYDEYTDNYNNIIEDLKDLNLDLDLQEIAKVPQSQRSVSGRGGSLSEQSKLREVANQTKVLARTLNLQFPKNDKAISGIQRVATICSNFHSVTRQLRNRYKQRPTIEIEDEYDVQDLLHSLLLLDFADIRTEEWTPSYAGGSSKMDFLLKDEKVVIETKKTRKGLSDKEVGEQLIIDIAKYQAHPDCKTLVCFVYDPEGKIGNPRGLEKDLESKSSADITIKVFIRP